MATDTRHRLSKMLLRHGRVYDAKAWTLAHDAWLGRQAVDEPAAQATLVDHYDAALQARLRRDRLDGAIAELAERPDLAPLVGRLRCLRGVSTLTAVGLAVEIGDWHRLSGATIGACLGLTPSESQSGARHTRGPITTTGNGHARRLLVEAAWHHRRAPRRSLELERRRAGCRPEVRARAEAAGALGLVVAFFHYMANEIRVERLIDAVWDETRAVAAQLPLLRDEAHPPLPDGPPAGVGRARRSGRVRTIADEDLAAIAREMGVGIEVVPGPGDFVAEGEVVVRVHGPGVVADGTARRAVEAIELGVHRTLTQDVAFGVDQLSDIALRALSPAVNDSTTAEEALMRSADLLRRLAGRVLGHHVADGDRVLMWRVRPSWDDLVARAFDQAAAEAEAQADAAISLVLVDALGRVLAATDDPVRMEPLRARVRRVRDGARRAIAEPSELARVESAAGRLV